MNPVRTGAAPAALVTLEEFKGHSRIDGNHYDADDTRILRTALAMLDGPNGLVRRAIVRGTWEATGSVWQDHPDGLNLGLPDAVSVEAITYYGSTNLQATLASATYRLDANSQRSLLVPVSGALWPPLYDRADALTVEFTAGMFAAPVAPATAWPAEAEPLRHAALLLADHLRNYRGLVTDRPVHEIPEAVERLIEPFKAQPVW